MIATITLNPSIDQNLEVRGLLKDDANRALRVSHTAGGKGLNVSKVVRELGGSTRAYALLGGFTGGWHRDLAKELDFPIHASLIRGETRVNAVVTAQKDRTQTRVSAPGPRVCAADLHRLLNKLLRVRPQPRFWVLGGSLPVGMQNDIYQKLILILQRTGTACVLDTDNEALKKGIHAKPFMIKPNEFEMARLLGRSLHSLKDYAAAAKHLAEKGVSLVAVSLAERGAIFVTKKEAIHVTTPKVKVQSKVGAGDSLIGGVILGLVRGFSLERAACLGVAASTSAVMREAPRLCLKTDIRPLLRRVRAHRLVL